MSGTRPDIIKMDLIRLIAKAIVGKTGNYQRCMNKIPERIVKIIVNRLFYEMNHACLEKKSIVISNFGTFKVIKKKARIGRDPRTGESIQIPPKWRVAFKSSANVRKLLDGEKL